jgi:hypothetical protein
MVEMLVLNSQTHKTVTLKLVHHHHLLNQQMADVVLRMETHIVLQVNVVLQMVYVEQLLNSAILTDAQTQYIMVKMFLWQACLLL